MEKMKLHPLIAGAAGALIIAAGVAVAAVTGLMSGSKAEIAAAPQAAEKPAVTQPAKPAQARQQVASAKPAATCKNCGVVVEVKEVEVPGKGKGIGAVAGGVGGAVIGREIGDGSRTGTAVGAVIGAVAGHQIERQARAHKRYDITVRMNDGSVRNLSDETGAAPAVRSGDKVRVSQDGTIRAI